MKVTREEARELMEKGGRTKAESIRFFLNYIERKEGKEGREKVEERLSELGYPVDTKKIKPFEWKEEGFSVLIILLAKELFGWTEEDVFDLGTEEPKASFIMKILMKHFITLERTIREAPRYWRKFYDFGSLEIPEFEKEEKYFVLRVKDYDLHPAVCKHHEGFFFAMAKFTVKGENLTIEERKCVHDGDPYHEYLIKWE